MNKIKNNFLRLIRIINKSEMRILPGHIAFCLVLSIIPILSLFGYFASKFSISIDAVTKVLNDSLPNQIVDILLPAFNSPGFVTNASMIIGFILASNGISAIVEASNMLFKLESRDFIGRRIKSFFMIIMIIMIFLFLIVVLAFGNNLLSWLFQLIYGKELPEITYTIFVSVKWVIGLCIAFIMLKTTFTMAPNKLIASKYMNKGSLFTTVTWLVATLLYSIYISKLANYNIFYGGLAGIAALMIWVYILSYSLVIGIAINSEVYLHAIEKQEEEQLHIELEKQKPVKRQSKK